MTLLATSLTTEMTVLKTFSSLKVESFFICKYTKYIHRQQEAKFIFAKHLFPIYFNYSNITTQTCHM